jgi:hypothetical protein
MTSNKIVENQFSKIATDIVPYTIKIEEPLKNKMIKDLKSSD